MKCSRCGEDTGLNATADIGSVCAACLAVLRSARITLISGFVLLIGGLLFLALLSWLLTG